VDLGHDLSQAMAYGTNFAGELSFGRRRYTRDLDGADIAIVGIPFDASTVNRPGTHFGPRAIREQASLVGCYPWGVGFTIIEANLLLDAPMAATAGRIREVAGDGPAYLTFDIDFLDPAYAPGTGAPVCGGPTTHQARTLLHALAGMNIVGADLVEVAPPYDPAGGPSRPQPWPTICSPFSPWPAAPAEKVPDRCAGARCRSPGCSAPHRCSCRPPG